MFESFFTSENIMIQCEPKIVEVNQLLLHASSAGDLGLALAAIEKGADPDCRDPRGFTPLMRAATYGEVGMLQLLMDAGASLDTVTEYGVTALMKAAIHDRSGAAQELVRCGADTSLRDADGQTAKEIAIKLGNNTTAAVL